MDSSHLPFCGPGFESQAQHLRFFSIYIAQIVYFSFELECDKNESKQKEVGIGPFKKLISRGYSFQILGRDARPLHPLENVSHDRDDDSHDLAHVRHRLSRAALRLEGPGL